MFTEELTNKTKCLAVTHLFNKEGYVAPYHNVLSIRQRINLTSRKNME
jgi:selenocysteine lyase/cysteine desulfurase